MKLQNGAMTTGEAYRILGLPPGADAEAIARAFRSAVKSAHPDLGGDADELRRVIEAHRVLKLPARAGLSFPPARSEPSFPRALPLEISVRQALFGGRRRVVLETGRAIDVRLPEGLRDGDALRLADADGEGAHVLLRISIAAEPGLSVSGHDVCMEARIRRDQLGPGARLRVHTPRGSRAVAAPEIPAEGAVIRLAGEGLPVRGPHPAGDLIVRLTLATAADEPASRRLLRRFAARWAA